MKIRRLWSVPLVVILALLAYFLLSDANRGDARVAAELAHQATALTPGSGVKQSANIQATDRAQASASWQGSPFLLGQAVTDGTGKLPDDKLLAVESPEVLGTPEPEIIPPAEAARRKKMIELGYMVPTEYYSKDLKTLRQMAKAGDAYAMVHIGEKYYFEMQGQLTHPEFDRNLDYPNAAKQSFKDALVAGNIRSAGIIAEVYYQEKNVTEAYAWHLVSDQLGDNISAEWFRRTDMAQQASAEVKQAAAARAAQIIEELKLKKKT